VVNEDRETEVVHLKRSLQFVGLLSLFLLVVPWALAQDAQISREGGVWGQVLKGSLAGVKNLQVKLDVGSVVVRGTHQADIDYTLHMRSKVSSEHDARRQFAEYKVTTYVKGDTAWVVGEWQGGHHVKLGPAQLRIYKGPEGTLSAEFAINIPREMSLVRIETAGGNIDATGVAGHVNAESGGGSMHLDDIGGGASADTGGGSIDVGTIGGELALRTGGGSIEVHHANGKIVAGTGGGSVEIVSAGEGASVETGGGSIEVRQCRGNAKVSTGGGSIDLGDVGGPAQIRTGGGSIHLASAQGYVEAQTGGGGIELYGVPSARAETAAGTIVAKFVKTGAQPHDSVLETSAGDITVYIAADVAISVRASVDLGNGHHITSEFSDIHVASEGDKWGPRTLNAEGRLNGGGPVLKVRTTTGDICFKRMNQ